MMKNNGRTMRVRLLRVSSISLLFYASSFAETVLRHEEGAGVVDRVIVLQRGQLDRLSAKEIAHKFLDRYSAGNVVLSLLFGVDDLEVRANLYHHFPSSSDRLTSLSGIVQDILKLGPPKEPIARVLSINGNVLLSYRDSSGLTEEVLHGSDPSRFRIDDFEFELLHLTFTKGTAAVAERMRYGLTFYLRVSPKVSLGATVAAARRQASLVKVNNVSVFVRPDPWFLESDDYPAYPAFVKKLSDPNAGQYELAPYTSCTFQHSHGITCSGRGFQP
jgi:hypothetical protein